MRQVCGFRVASGLRFQVCGFRVASGLRFQGCVRFAVSGLRFQSCVLKNAQPKELEKLFDDFSHIELDTSLVREIFQIFLKYPGNIESQYVQNALKSVQSTSSDYLGYARESKGVLSPNEWISFFEVCADNDENAFKVILTSISIEDSIGS